MQCAPLPLSSTALPRCPAPPAQVLPRPSASPHHRLPRQHCGDASDSANIYTLQACNHLHATSIQMKRADAGRISRGRPRRATAEPRLRARATTVLPSSADCSARVLPVHVYTVTCAYVLVAPDRYAHDDCSARVVPKHVYTFTRFTTCTP